VTHYRRLHRAGLLVLSVFALSLLAGCGSSSSNPSGPDVGPNVGAPINLADCTDWNQADVEERLGTIRQLKDFAGGPVVGASASDPSGTGAVLDDEEAYKLLNRYCESDFARGFKLYKLYERAAAFSGHPG
jgi:hypothetical protein